MTHQFDNRATRLLRCRIPIVLAGMGGVARSDLVAAVTAAGGLGFLGMVREPVKLIEREVARVRALGQQWFGVNIIPAATDPALLDRQVAVCIDLAVPVVGLFWDIDDAVVTRLRKAGIVVVYQVGSVDEAIASERVGAQVIIAQGREAGGHVRGTRRLRDLLPGVVDAVKVPVLAAGGLASGADLVTALALGAEGMVLGTALMATGESFAHDVHKQALVTARAEDTVLTDAFHINWPPAAPVRVLKSAVTNGQRGSTHSANRTVIGAEEGRPIYLFSTDSPLRSMTGEFTAMALYAGTGVGQVDAIVTAGERLDAIMAEADALLAAAADNEWPEAASPVCYAGEISGAYMGQMEKAEIAEHVAVIAGDLRMVLRLLLADRPDQRPSEPPFEAGAVHHARWTLRLGALANGLGMRVVNPHFAVPPLPEIAWEIGRLHVSMLNRLGQVIPGLPEDATRRELTALLAFLESRNAVAVRPIDLKRVGKPA